MAVPKQHDSKSKVGKRRSQKNLKKQNLHKCDECSAPKLAHRACSNCGAYKSEGKKKEAPKAQMEEKTEKAEEQSAEEAEETEKEEEVEEDSEETKEDKEDN